MLASAQCSLELTSAAELLVGREAYPERPKRVELVETPYSWVFLADRHVYKLKKPVKFGPIDFSSSILRRQACIDEVWQNQRLTSGVYQAVVPVVSNIHGTLSLGGTGVPVDWTVKMRRLPNERNFGVLLAGNRLGSEEIRSVAGTLAAFFRNRPPVTVQLTTFRERLAHQVQDNQRVLENRVRPGLCDTVRHIHDLQLEFVDSAKEILNRRVGDGLIVDGHGDLCSAHIFMEHQPQVIDCLECDCPFRQVDVVDDLCLLLIECERLDRLDVSEAILAEYTRNMSDHVPKRLCNFYKSYRACVWARRVLLLARHRGHRRGQASVESAVTEEEYYLQLAKKYAAMLLGSR